MIEETDKINYNNQEITYGIANGVRFRLEVDEVVTIGTVSKLKIREFDAGVTEGLSTVVTSDIPDEYKLHVADINRRYGTYFLVQSQISEVEETK